MTYREAIDDNMRRFYSDHTDIRKIRSEKKATRDSIPPSSGRDMPGSILHISLPPGTEVDFLNLFELISPDGVSLDARLPFLSADSGSSLFPSGIADLVNSIKQAGGTFEITRL